MIKDYFKYLMIFCALGYGLTTFGQGTDCASAVAVTAGSYIGDGPLDGDGAASGCEATPATHSDWYVYTPTIDLEVTISSSVDMDQPDTRVSIYTGDCSNLVCHTSDDDSGEDFTSIVTFDAIGGTTYYIEWDDRWSSEEYDWVLDEFIIPDNTPDCPGLITPEDNANNVMIDEANSNSVTLTWVNATTGDLADENNLHFGIDPTSLVDVGVIGGSTETINISNIMSFTTYYWSVVPSNGAGTTFDCDIFSFTTEMLTVDCPLLGLNIGDPCDDGNQNTNADTVTENCVCIGTPSSANEVCDNALEIGEGIFTDPGASGGGGASNACMFGGINASWYAYTASGSGVVTVTSGIDLDQPDTRLSVHSACDNLDCIAFNEDDIPLVTSRVTFDAIAGTTYLIEWDGRWDGGEFDFQVSLEISDILGCMDASACNYNDLATFDNGTCIHAVGCDTCSGETDGTGVVIDNPEIGDDCDDGDITTENDVITDCNGTCVGQAIEISGCMDSSACNFNVAATQNSGSCIYATGCDTCSGETDGTGVVVNNPEIGDGCNDGDTTTENDVITDCNGTCVGQPIVLAENAFCEDAIAIGEGVVFGANISGGEAASNACFNETTLSAIWYAYTPSANGTATIFSHIINSNDPDTRLAVHSSCGSLDCLAHDDDGGEGYTSMVSINVIAGNTYIIEWDDRWSSDPFDFEITLGATEVLGCMDASACNFNSSVTLDNGTCIYATGCDVCSGETDGTGVVIDNPEIGDTCDDGDTSTENDVITDCTGTCEGQPIIFSGCMDSSACNYDDSATQDNGSCIYATGCDTCSGETDGTGVVIDNPEIGDICDDGDTNTVDDVIQDDCSCQGTIESGCPTDFNNDGTTNGGDFEIFLGNFNIDCADGDCPTDINNDGTTNGGDFEIFLGNFNLDCEPLCPTDFNNDNFTDGDDFVIFLGNFGFVCGDGPCVADIDGSGVVDGGDFEIFLGNFNLPCE